MYHSIRYESDFVWYFSVYYEKNIFASCFSYDNLMITNLTLPMLITSVMRIASIIPPEKWLNTFLKATNLQNSCDRMIKVIPKKGMIINLFIDYWFVYSTLQLLSPLLWTGYDCCWCQWIFVKNWIKRAISQTARNTLNFIASRF